MNINELLWALRYNSGLIFVKRKTISGAGSSATTYQHESLKLINCRNIIWPILQGRIVVPMVGNKNNKGEKNFTSQSIKNSIPKMNAHSRL